MIIFVLMNTPKTKNQTLNAKGAAIFKKMLEDKRAIHEHLKKGGKLTDLKDKYKFATPISLNRNK